MIKGILHTIITHVTASHPWSNSSPRQDPVPVLLSCLPPNAGRLKNEESGERGRESKREIGPVTQASGRISVGSGREHKHKEWRRGRERKRERENEEANMNTKREERSRRAPQTPC